MAGSAVARVSLLCGALLLSLAVLVMHCLPASGTTHQHTAAVATSTAPMAAMSRAATASVLPAGCEHPSHAAHTHDCMGVPVEHTALPPTIALVCDGARPVGLPTTTVTWLRAIRGRSPPWTTASLSQLSILRV